MTHHVIMMSGGAGSFAAAKRVLAGKPMAKFRRRVETKKFVEGMEWGGCGCFSDD